MKLLTINPHQSPAAWRARPRPLPTGRASGGRTGHRSVQMVRRYMQVWQTVSRK